MTNSSEVIKAKKTASSCFTGDEGAVISVITENKKNIRDAIVSELTSEQNYLHGKACAKLLETKSNIQDIIDINRGGATGMHGFIAEQLETGIGNAKSIMNGDGVRYILLDDNGRDDLLIDSVPVQMKFVQKALSLDAVKEHIQKYPEAIAEGEVYMIPKDYWEKLQLLWNLSPEEAGSLRNTDYNLWLKLHELSAEGITKEKLCAAEFGYDGAQRETYVETLDDCKNQVSEQRDKNVAKIIEEHSPTIKEAAQTVLLGAGMEGVLQAAISVFEKHQEGIDFKDYSKDDVIYVLKKSGLGALNGGLRSGVVYLAVNFTPIPAGVVSGAYTIAEKAIEIGVTADKNEESRKQAKEEIIATVVEVSVTTLLSIVGAKAFKKNKAIGAMIGTVAAKAIIYTGKKAKSFFAEKEAA